MKESMPEVGQGDELRRRVLRAAATAYIQHHKLPADAKPEDYARHLARQWESDPAGIPEGVQVSLDLRDALEAARRVDRGDSALARLDVERRALDSWIAAWRSARDLMLDKSIPWKSRASLVLQALHIHGRRKAADADELLRQRWIELTEGLVDGPPLDVGEALVVIAEERDQSLAAAARALVRAGAKRVPRLF